MILDERAEFCDATTATGTDASAIVGDVMDTGNFTKDHGASGEPIYLVIQVTTAYSGGTSVAFELRTSTLAALTGGTTTTLLSTSAIAVGTAVAGYTLVYALPSNTYQQYLGMWKVTVGAVAAGAINAFLTKNAARWRAYSDQDPGAV